MPNVTCNTAGWCGHATRRGGVVSISANGCNGSQKGEGVGWWVDTVNVMMARALHVRAARASMSTSIRAHPRRESEEQQVTASRGHWWVASSPSFCEGEGGAGTIHQCPRAASRYRLEGVSWWFSLHIRNLVL